MDWTWRLDSVVPVALELAVVAGGVVALLACLAGGLSLVARRAVRLGLQVAFSLSLGLGLAGHGEAAALAAFVTIVAAAGAAVVAALAKAFRRVRGAPKRAALAACCVLVLDGYHTSSGTDWPVVAFVLVGLLWLGLLAGHLAMRRWRAVRALAVACAVWAAAIAAFGAWSRFNLRLAEGRARAVIAACRDFERDHRRLPATLDELVPAYLPQVPRANWTILGHFVYEPERSALSWLDPWPHERTFSFTTGKWDRHRLFGLPDDVDDEDDTEDGAALDA